MGPMDWGVSGCWSLMRIFALSFSFFRFIRRFWNQTFTWRSERCSLHEISQRFWRVMYGLLTNSFSRTIVWYRVYGFRFFRCLGWSERMTRLIDWLVN